MQYQELITKIAENKEYLTICRKITGGNLLYKDLFQEALLILLEYNNEKIIDIYRQGRIRFFFARICTNLYRNKNSTFNKKYLRYEYPLNGSVLIEDENYDFEKDEEYESKRRLVQKELKIKNDDDPLWYENSIFKHYLKEGTIIKLAKNTGIKYQSLETTIRRVRNRIRKQYETQDTINHE